MKKIILTVGLPGCGKTTWAKDFQASNPHQYKRINKDDLREMLDAGVWSKHNEKFVLQVRNYMVEMALVEGKHVIIDDTNLHDKHIETMKQIAKKYGAMVEIKSFTDVPVEECIKRDLNRMKSVGKDVIMSMYKQFLKPDTSESDVPYDPSLPDAIIVDVDGTLAHKGNRSPYDWGKVKEDTVDTWIKNIVNRYGSDCEVLVVTGRDGVCLPDTVAWLNENHILYNEVFIRPEGNKEKDAIIKRRIYEENIKGKYNVLFVLDDRNQVVEMWRSLGLKCLQVAEGDF